MKSIPSGDCRESSNVPSVKRCRRDDLPTAESPRITIPNLKFQGTSILTSVCNQYYNKHLYVHTQNTSLTLTMSVLTSKHLPLQWLNKLVKNKSRFTKKCCIHTHITITVVSLCHKSFIVVSWHTDLLTHLTFDGSDRMNFYIIL